VLLYYGILAAAYWYLLLVVNVFVVGDFSSPICARTSTLMFLLSLLLSSERGISE